MHNYGVHCLTVASGERKCTNQSPKVVHPFWEMGWLGENQNWAEPYYTNMAGFKNRLDLSLKVGASIGSFS